MKTKKLLNKKILFISVILIVIFICIGVFVIIEYNSPRETIIRQFQIKLPQEINIINYTKENRYELHAKLLVADSDIDFIRENIRLYNMHDKIKALVTPDVQSTVNWWDMDKDKVKFCYIKVYSREGFFSGWGSGHMWIFITKEADGKTYLYLTKD